MEYYGDTRWQLRNLVKILKIGSYITNSKSIDNKKTDNGKQLPKGNKIITKETR